MKFWKKFKKKLRNNKLYRMYIILGAVCQIGAIVFGVLAGFQKDELDNIEKHKNKTIHDEILKSTKETEFNTNCTSFFNEHKFERFKHHFIKGYIIVRQDEFNRLCKKTFGDKHFTDFSEFKIYKKENEYFFHNKFEFAQNILGKNGTYINSSFSEDNRIDINILNRPQRIFGWSIELPDGRKIVNALVIIRNIKPYVYAFGLTFKDKTISVRN